MQDAESQLSLMDRLSHLSGEGSGERAQDGVSSTFSHQTLAVHCSGETRTHTPKQTLSKVCCICAEEAIYTCPGCGRLTCSIACVRSHKDFFKCTGMKDPAAHVSLATFSDKQLERDFVFLENCRRVLTNIERGISLDPVPSTCERFNNLNSNALHSGICEMTRAPSLQKASRERRILLQLISPGMRKHDCNTSYYDEANQSIWWRCDFSRFQDSEKKSIVSMDRVHEQSKIYSVFSKYCEATNICFHSTESNNSSPSTSCFSTEDQIVEPQNANMLAQDFSFVLLYKMEKLGLRVCYYHLPADISLYDALKTVGFVTEYPEFYAVRKDQAAEYPHATDHDIAHLQSALSSALAKNSPISKRRKRSRQTAG